MTDWLGRYEDWLLDSGTRPSVLAFATVFAVLALVTFPAYPRLSPSLRAAAWFWLVNVAAWSYLYWSRSLGLEWSRHVRLVLIHAIIPVGGWLTVRVFGRIFLGWEDESGKPRAGR